MRGGHLLLTSKQVDARLEGLEPEADDSVVLKLTESSGEKA